MCLFLQKYNISSSVDLLFEFFKVDAATVNRKYCEKFRYAIFFLTVFQLMQRKLETHTVFTIVILHASIVTLTTQKDN